jgi:hypothetical protein
MTPHTSLPPANLSKVGWPDPKEPTENFRPYRKYFPAILRSRTKKFTQIREKIYFGKIEVDVFLTWV